MSKHDTSRRTALGALGTAVLTTAIIGDALADDVADVAAALEGLRKAMLAGDGAALDALTAAELTYGHSNARIESKAEYVASLAGKTAFQTLEFSAAKTAVVGDTAVVRHTFDSINNLPDGKTSTAHIHVLTVWKKIGGGWKLLARQSVPLPS